MNIIELDKYALHDAKNLLEYPGLAVQISSAIGTPIERGLDKLPASWFNNISQLSQTALLKAAETAIFSLKDIPGEHSSERWHKFGAALSGGVGGFFGTHGIAVELPLSTTIMLRSIADIARSEGEWLSDIDTKMACLEVFAMGGTAESDDHSELGYYSIRYALAKSVSEASEFIIKKGLSDEGAPLLLHLISKIAQKFGVHVSQKAAAQAIPAIGAAGGAMINTLFISHYQQMAKGHFVIRRLERMYGQEKIKALYLALPNPNSNTNKR